MKVKLIGVGGIGGCVLPILARYLAHLKDDAGVHVLTLIDGDKFESRNADRQRFSKLGNKAEVLAEALQAELPDLLITAVGEMVTDGNVTSLIREGDVVMLCVDNHQSRLLVSERAEELTNVCVISGGNDLVDGSVQVYIRRGGVDLTAPLANDYHPEIKAAESTAPRADGCGEIVTSEPQLLFTNNFVAAAMCNAFYGYINGNVHYDTVYVDIAINAARATRQNG